MPARSRSAAAVTDVVPDQTPDAPEVAPEAPESTPEQPPARHTQPTPKIIKGRLIGDPEGRFTPGGKLVAKMRIAEEGERPVNWTVSLWEKRAERAVENLRKGDVIKVVGRWEADREFTSRVDNTTGYATHEITGQDVGVVSGDKTIPLDQFDRSMLDAPALAPSGLDAPDF